MNGAELDTTEFAYLLAMVDASGVIGLEDPELFPAKTADREATYDEGRKKLETGGWLKPSADYEDEYELDAFLFEMVSIIADPENIVATVHSGNGKARQMVMHYLSNGTIVELSAPNAKGYAIGVVPDQKALQARVAEMLGVAGKRKEVRFSLDQDAHNNIRALSKNGEQEEAKALLEATQLSGPAKNSFVAAMGESEHGQIVVIRPEAGEIEAGRRSTLYGEDKTAWLVSRSSSDSTELEVRNGDVAGIGKLISERLKELSTG